MKDTFPPGIKKVFFSYGYDFELMSSDDETQVAFNFFENMYEWFKNNVTNKKFLLSSKDINGVTIISRQCQIMPVLVLINIPEVGI